MKILYILALALTVLNTASWAQNQEATDQVYRDLAELRRQMVKMQREIKAFVDEVATPYAASSGQAVTADVRVDIQDNEKNMVVRADLPGMEKNKLDITLERGKTLKIAGSREYQKKESTPGMVRQERSYGHFERILELPSEGMSEGIRADYKDGVLEVTIPKKKASKEDTVKIKVQ